MSVVGLEIQQESGRELVALGRTLPANSERVFHVEFARLCDASGCKMRDLADAVGIGRSHLSNWKSGAYAPSRNYKDVIHRFEEMFGVPKNHLWGLVHLTSRKGRARLGRYHGIEDSKAVRTQVTRSFTAAEMLAPPDEFRKLYEAAKQRKIERVDPLMVAVQRSRPDERPFVVSERLNSDLEQLLQLSTMQSWDVGLDMLPLKQRKGRGADWEVRRLKRVLQFVSCHEEGPGVAPDDLTLGLFLYPDFTRREIAAKQVRMKQTTGKLYLVGEDIDQFSAGKTLVQAPNGYVFQNPEKFLAELKPVEGFITPRDIQAAERDWEGACARAVARYDNYKQSYGQFERIVVNRKVAVEKVLDFEDPLFVLEVLNERMARLFLGADDQAHWWIDHTLDCVLARIATDAGFRNETFHKLDVTELKETSQGWRLQVSRRKFKNPEGPHFHLGSGKYRDFDRLLTDENGVGDIIEAYLSKARPAIAGARGSTALFINTTNRPAHMALKHYPRILPDQFSERFRNMTELHLCGLEDGIPGVMPFSTHQCRAVVCAGNLKRAARKFGVGNALQMAADAICDGINVAMYHYSRWSAYEREKALLSLKDAAA
jgi:hypothetical protein